MRNLIATPLIVALASCGQVKPYVMPPNKPVADLILVNPKFEQAHLLHYADNRACTTPELVQKGTLKAGQTLSIPLEAEREHSFEFGLILSTEMQALLLGTKGLKVCSVFFTIPIEAGFNYRITPVLPVPDTIDCKLIMERSKVAGTWENAPAKIREYSGQNGEMCKPL